MTAKQRNEIEGFAKYCILEDRSFQSFFETVHSDYPDVSRDEARHHWDMVYENTDY